MASSFGNNILPIYLIHISNTMMTKNFLLAVAAACLTQEYSNAASIVSAQMWITIADGGYPSTPVTLADGVFPPEFMTFDGYQGFAGGQMTIRLNEAEEVISAGYRITTIESNEGPGHGTSTLSQPFSLRGVFPQYGSQSGDQLWEVTGPHWWAHNWGSSGVLFSDLSYVFVVETNLGTFENGFNGGAYFGRYVNIPEPSAASIALMAILYCLKRKRAVITCCVKTTEAEQAAPRNC